MADLLVAPYLPLTSRAAFGPWELVPFGTVLESGLVPTTLSASVSRLLAAYRLPGRATGIGAVVLPRDELVGSPVDPLAVGDLGRSLFAGTVGSNPRLALSDDEQEENTGWAIATTENALLWGHPLGDGDKYVLETGVLASVVSVRQAPADEPLPTIEPPFDLATPFLGAFDEELAGGVHQVLCDSGDDTRRLRRTIDWIRIVVSNAEAVTLDVRVGAARSALEVLTGAGDTTKKLVRAYGRLMRQDAEVQRTYDRVFWAKGPVQLTGAEWWLSRLCELRNVIVHGGEPTPDLWLHDGISQLYHMHDNLLDAMRTTVAAWAADPPLRLRQSERVWERAALDTLEYLRARDRPDGESHATSA